MGVGGPDGAVDIERFIPGTPPFNTFLGDDVSTRPIAMSVLVSAGQDR